MKAFKYLFFLILPLSIYISFTSFGWLTILPLIIFFGIVPLLELLFSPDKKNLTKEEEEKEKENTVYSGILYLTLPIQLFFLGWFIIMFSEPTTLTTLEYVGRVSAMGLMCGVIGINVGHELGHRHVRFEQFLGEILLLSSLNTHFLPYHNAGHHLNVATPDDAATARKNEILYFFWIRSHFQSYYQAWSAENKRLKNTGRSWFHIQNRMLIYTLCNIALLNGIYLFFGVSALVAFVFASIIGILLLETVNYIEHYGLLRKKNEHGRYERVKRTHSWNSDHAIGKLILFNLSRHSDHHYNGSKHYQLLKTLPESPQMPAGYTGMMVLALFPPLWFKLMNKKLQQL